MMVLMESVTIEREFGSGEGAVMTRIPNSDHTWSSLVLMLLWLFDIGSDVVLTTGNYQAYPDL